MLNAETKEDLSKLEIPNEFIKTYISSALYFDSKLDDLHLSKQEFEKSGSRTLLIGGTLKNKIIIRFIKPCHFIL